MNVEYVFDNFFILEQGSGWLIVHTELLAMHLS